MLARPFARGVCRRARVPHALPSAARRTLSGTDRHSDGGAEFERSATYVSLTRKHLLQTEVDYAGMEAAVRAEEDADSSLKMRYGMRGLGALVTAAAAGYGVYSVAVDVFGGEDADAAEEGDAAAEALRSARMDEIEELPQLEQAGVNIRRHQEPQWVMRARRDFLHARLRQREVTSARHRTVTMARAKAGLDNFITAVGESPVKALSIASSPYGLAAVRADLASSFYDGSPKPSPSDASRAAAIRKGDLKRATAESIRAKVVVPPQ